MTVKTLKTILEACSDEDIIYVSIDNGYEEREYSESSDIDVEIQGTEVWINGNNAY